MLSDEEKKAIERLNKRYEFFKENPLATNVWLTLDIHNLGIALNLIEKQQKEIKCDNLMLKRAIEIKDRQSKEIEELKELTLIQRKQLNDAFDRGWIHKDKIIAKVIEVKDRPVKDEFITATQGKLDTIIDIESLLGKE